MLCPTTLGASRDGALHQSACRGAAGRHHVPVVPQRHVLGSAARMVTTQRCCVAVSSTDHATAPSPPRLHRLSAAGSERLLTVEECAAEAAARGLSLRLSTFGPFFKIACTTVADGTVVGEIEGFAASPPLALLHLDAVRVYNSRLSGPLRLRSQTAFGLGLLLGAAAFAHGHAQGCRKAELLAIDDGNAYAPRLVAYYRRLGFVPVKTVGGGALSDLPDLLVWGGPGTRMDADVAPLLARWTKAVTVRSRPLVRDVCTTS